MGLDDLLMKIPPIVRGYGAGLIWAGSMHVVFADSFRQSPELYVSYVAGCMIGFIESRRYGAQAAARQLNITIAPPKTGLKQVLKEHAPTLVGALTMVASLALIDTNLRTKLYWADEMLRQGWGSLKLYNNEIKRLAQLQDNKIPLSWMLGLTTGTMTFINQEINDKGLLTSVKAMMSSWRYVLGDRFREQWYDGPIIDDDPEYGVEAVAWALGRGKYKKAFSYARRTIEANKGSHRNHVMLSELGAQMMHPLSPEQMLNFALCSYTVGDKARALEILEAADDDVTTQILCARAAKALGDNDKARIYLGRAATKMVSDNQFRLERRGESTNPVYFVEDPHFDELVVFKQSPQEEIPKQKLLLEEARVALAPLSQVELSDLVETIDIGDKTLGVWEMMKGRTLYDLARENPQKAFPYVSDAAKATGYLLGALKAQGVLPDMRKKIRSRILTIAQSVQDHLTEPPESMADLAAENADPILESYSWIPLVRRMDRHLENYLAREEAGSWWTTKRIISVIDFDVVNDPIPLSCESANLLAYVPVFSDAQVDMALAEMERAFNSASPMPLARGALHKAHPLGVLQRGIDLTGAWSSESRRSLWPDRYPLWTYAQRQIDRVHRMNQGFFREYERQFKVLDHVFEVIGAALKTYGGRQTSM